MEAVSYQTDATSTLYTSVCATNHVHAFAGEVTVMSLR